MTDFLLSLRSELLTENLIPMNNNKPPALLNILRQLAKVDRFMYMICTEATNYYLNTKPNGTAAIGWDTSDPGKLALMIGPKCISGGEQVMAFVLAHEFAHFFRHHIDEGLYTHYADHEAANIVEDSMIDDTVLKQGSFAGIRVKTPFPVFTLHTETYGGMKQNCLDVLAGEKYEGPELSKNVYEWYLKNKNKIKENFNKENKDQDEDEDEKNQQQQNGKGPQGPQYPKVGDIVFNKKTGEYGKVTSVDSATQKVNSVIPMDKASAEAEVKKMGGV